MGGGAWTLAWSGTTPGGTGKDWKALRTGTDVDHNGYPDLALVQEETFGLFNDRNVLYAYREASVPAAPAVRLTEPAPGRVWHAGQARFVDWTAAVPGLTPGGDAGSVRVQLSDSGATGPWTTLAAAVPNNGRWQLVVPPGLDGSDCWLRLVLTTPAGQVATKRGPFTILP